MLPTLRTPPMTLHSHVKMDDVRGDEPAAEWVAANTLTPWDANPRKNDHAAKEVAESIKRFGWGAPIVARREDGQVIAGHTRLKAAAILGLDTVPVRFVEVDEREAHLMALADNKLTEKAAWDEPKLAMVLDDYSLPEAELAGWDSKELEKLADAVPDFGPMEAGDDTDKLKDGFSVVIECEDEAQQREVLELCHERGLKCRAWI